METLLQRTCLESRGSLTDGTEVSRPESVTSTLQIGNGLGREGQQPMGTAPLTDSQIIPAGAPFGP